MSDQVTVTTAAPTTTTNSTAAKPKSPTLLELMAEIERLKAANAALAAQPKAQGQITVKVTEKGGISIYGIGRFPTTLYASQWQRILAPAVRDAILSLIDADLKLPTAQRKLAWKE